MKEGLRVSKWEVSVGILILPLPSEPGNEALGSKSPTTVVAPATDIEVMKSESKSRVVGSWME